jgi:hypothetical protein
MEDCPSCGSVAIARKDDSHWIIAIKREEELDQLLESARVVLILFDRTAPSPLDIRVRAWEIWPADERCAYFRDFFTDYFSNNYMAKRREGLEPAPCNLHPLKFDHLMMNPLKTLDARIDSPDSEDARAHVDYLFPAEEDRGIVEPEEMPVRLLRQTEVARLLEMDLGAFEPYLKTDRTLDDIAVALRSRGPVSALESVVTNVPWQVRVGLPMRTKRIKKTPSRYKRRRNRS